MSGGSFIKGTAAGPHQNWLLGTCQYPVGPHARIIKIGFHYATILVVIRRVEFVAETVVDGQLRADFPDVFEVGRPRSGPELDARQSSCPVEGREIPD